jgi:thioredoxin reductase
MPDVVVVGGGPAGLSAALFAAKNGLETIVFDTDETWLHSAYLFNYLGIDEMDGSQFVHDAREQVRDFGARLHLDESVTDVERDGDGFKVTTEDGEYRGTYVVLATGTDRDLAESLGCAFDANDTVEVDLDLETSVDDVYATGGMVRDQTWQAVISAGDGGAAALDVLSKEKGERFHDFDTPDAA